MCWGCEGGWYLSDFLGSLSSLESQVLLLQLLLMTGGVALQGHPAPPSRSFLICFSQGFSPWGKKAGQERVKWSAERRCLPGGQVGMLPCQDNRDTRASYVRNEPASLQPTPSSVQGTVEPLRLLPSPWGLLCLCFPPALAFAGPSAPDWHRLGPERWRPGEQVASGLGQRLSPAAGRPASGGCLCLALVSLLPFVRRDTSGTRANTSL